MTDAEYNLAIQRFRRSHWLHFGVQGLLMSGAALAGKGKLTTAVAGNSWLITWPIWVALTLALLLLGMVLYTVCRRIRPNLRRPYAENMRIYQSRLVVRNSLVGLSSLPLLAANLFTHQGVILVAYVGLLLLLGWRLVPSARTYQRWLLS
ncbi:hypothetical protein QMK33_02390 [Hymenobacter sp. H14-R3]|uniref:hypothetical protein n=1 Tax=Hymenobacter sp. H14-R3 TaxID=3046308 RepID=UPI0024B8B324|nr:hypothetical protein [Hymenobacter sp. H14-R3]MDJ0363986.1 hypothetical protein [Hymenobacter sp. H14-R3]